MPNASITPPIPMPTRRRRRVLLSPLVALGLVVAAQAFVMDACNPSISLRGNTFVNAYCSEDGHGAYFTNTLTGFPGSTKFHYHVQVRFNGGLVQDYDTASYYTTYLGDHHGNGRTYVCECIAGVYAITVWATTDDGKYQSSSGWDEVACLG